MADAWTITNERHDAHTLGQFNSVCTVSNGYLGLKGNVAEDRDGYSPVALINGVYDELDMFGTLRASNEERRYLDPEYFDSAGRSPAVANLPNPCFVRLFVGDEEITLTRGEVRGFVQGLDLRSGVYSYQFQVVDRHGRTTRVAMTRFASMTDPHRAFMRYAVTPIDHAAPIRILSGIDGNTHSNTTGERQYRVTGRDVQENERVLLSAQTPARGHTLDFRVRNTFHGPVGATARPVVEHNAAYTEYSFTPRANQAHVVDRFLVLTCSEDRRHGVAIDPAAELEAAAALGFDDALQAQREWWDACWAVADVEIDGDEPGQRYLRFCIYHIMAAAPRHSDKLPVPVKLLTGEYYQGNTFYDTDTYIVPVYTFVAPELARGALNWRYEGLEPGRQIARELGYQGAKFAWQAGPYGEECLGHWYRFTKTNIHINGDVAYALMQYAWASGDWEFVARRGGDILVEAARFYASRATADADGQSYHLVGVTGPDEGHVAVTDDFFTNHLAAHTLRWASAAVEGGGAVPLDDAARSSLAKRLNVAPTEPQQWRRVADGLVLRLDPQRRVYEQCEGFYQLKEIPPQLDRTRKVWFETVFPYQALNQPDVVMSLVMFRDEFPTDVARANWDFYKDKSMNFSSMSFVLNSIMAADMGEMDRAHENFIISAGEDLDEELTGRKDTFAGLHGTASGGAWMAAVLGFGGVNVSPTGLRINPNLPPQWQGLRFHIHHLGSRLQVKVGPREVSVTRDQEGPEQLTLTIAGRPVTLGRGQSHDGTYR